jgi:hypothetical protein
MAREVVVAIRDGKLDLGPWEHWDPTRDVTCLTLAKFRRPSGARESYAMIPVAALGDSLADRLHSGIPPGSMEGGAGRVGDIFL